MGKSLIAQVIALVFFAAFYCACAPSGQPADALAPSSSFQESQESRQAPAVLSSGDVQRLIGTIRSGDSYQRETAKQQLKESKDPQLVQELIAALKDPHDEVREFSASVLAEKKDSKAVLALIQAAKDRKRWVRAAALNALGEIADPKAVPALIDALWDPAQDVSNLALRALGGMQDPRVVPALVAQMWVSNKERRKAAIEILGKRGEPETVPALIRVLRDRDSEIRALAIKGLGQKEDPRAGRALLMELKDARVDDVRPLVDALKGKKEQEFVATLIAKLERTEEYRTRNVLVHILGEIGDPQATPALVKWMNGASSGYERRNAIEALSKIKDPASVPDILALLAMDPDEHVRKSAAEVVGVMGGAKAIAGLVQARQDPDGNVRREAISGLERIEDPASIPDFLELLKINPDKEIRKTAAEVVGKIGGSKATAGLMAALHDPESHVRMVAIDALAKIKDPDSIPDLVAAMRDPCLDVRCRATYTLGALKASEAVPMLAEMAKGKSVADQQRAIGVLGMIGDDFAVSTLAALLNDPKSKEHSRVVTTLGTISTPLAITALVEAPKGLEEESRRAIIEVLMKHKGPQIDLALVDALEDSRSTVRLMAIEGLGERGGPLAVSALIQFMNKSKDEAECWASVQALGKTKDPAAVPALVKILDDPSWWIRGLAIDSLAALEGREALAALFEATDHRQYDVRVRAAERLNLMSDTETLQTLLEMFKDPDFVMCPAAVQKLRGIRDSQQTGPILLRALNDPQEAVRAAAALVLGGTKDVPASVLVDALKDEKAPVRCAAAQALGERCDESAVPAFVEALHDPDDNVRQWAARALGSFKNPSAVRGLIDALKDSNSAVRQFAAQSLGQIKYPGATPFLIETLKDPSDIVKRIAVQALGSFKDSLAVPALIDVLKKRSWWDSEEKRSVREAAAVSLGEIGDPSAIPVLLEASKDLYLVRYNAFSALGKINNFQAVPGLLMAMGSTDIFRRQAATNALGAISDPQAVPMLRGALKDTRSAMRKKLFYMWRILRKIGEPDISEYKLEDPHDKVRETAAHVLGQIRDTDTVWDLFELLEDPLFDVRSAAYNALMRFRFKRDGETFVPLPDGETISIYDRLKDLCEIALHIQKPRTAVNILVIASRVLPYDPDMRAYAPDRTVCTINEMIDDWKERVLSHGREHIPERKVLEMIVRAEPLGVFFAEWSPFPSAFSGELDKSIIENTIRALGSIGDSDAVKALLLVLRRGGHPGECAEQALLEIGWPALEPLRQVERRFSLRRKSAERRILVRLGDETTAKKVMAERYWEGNIDPQMVGAITAYYLKHRADPDVIEWLRGVVLSVTGLSGMLNRIMSGGGYLQTEAACGALWQLGDHQWLEETRKRCEARDIYMIRQGAWRGEEQGGHLLPEGKEAPPEGHDWDAPPKRIAPLVDAIKGLDVFVQERLRKGSIMLSLVSLLRQPSSRQFLTDFLLRDSAASVRPLVCALQSDNTEVRDFAHSVLADTRFPSAFLSEDDQKVVGDYQFFEKQVELWGNVLSSSRYMDLAGKFDRLERSSQVLRVARLLTRRNVVSRLADVMAVAHGGDLFLEWLADLAAGENGDIIGLISESGNVKSRAGEVRVVRDVARNVLSAFNASKEGQGQKALEKLEDELIIRDSVKVLRAFLFSDATPLEYKALVAQAIENYYRGGPRGDLSKAMLEKPDTGPVFPIKKTMISRLKTALEKMIGDGGESEKSL